jgi:hypothetical protein
MIASAPETTATRLGGGIIKDCNNWNKGMYSALSTGLAQCCPLATSLAGQVAEFGIDVESVPFLPEAGGSQKRRPRTGKGIEHSSAFGTIGVVSHTSLAMSFLSPSGYTTFRPERLE